MRFACLFFLCTLSRLALGQDIVVLGNVSAQHGEGIPYATLKLKQAKKGIVTDRQGRFALKLLPENLYDTLVVSSLGYEEVLMAVSSIDFKNELKIQLAEEFYQLDTAGVEARGLENIIRKAIENIDETFQTKSYTYPAFYRQYHIEDGKCVRLIEAAFDMHDLGYAKTSSAVQSEKLKLLGLRRSDNYEMNHAEHGNHLKDLIFENSVHYRIGTVLNEKSLRNVRFYRGVDTDITGDVKRINYAYSDPKDKRARKGTIFLKGDKFKITRIEETTYPNAEYVGSWARNTAGYDWIFREGQKVVQYKEIDGKIYLDSISYYYKHDLIHPVFHTIDFTVEESFNLWCGKPQLIEEGVTSDRQYKKSLFLYGKRYEYNKEFWDGYPMLKNHPFSNSLVHELEWKKALEEQFVKNAIN